MSPCIHGSWLTRSGGTSGVTQRTACTPSSSLILRTRSFGSESVCILVVVNSIRPSTRGNPPVRLSLPPTRKVWNSSLIVIFARFFFDALP